MLQSKNMKHLHVFLSVCILSGCMHRPTTPSMSTGFKISAPPPAPTVSQIQNCEKARSAHNTWSILGAVFGGVAGASGTLDAAISDHNAQIGIGIGAAASGIFAAVATTISSFEADAYSSNNCATILSNAVTLGMIPGA